jgi:hypothetical protein
VALETLLYYVWQSYLAIRSAVRFTRLRGAIALRSASILLRKSAKASMRYRSTLGADHMHDAVYFYWQARGYEGRRKLEAQTRLLIRGFCAKGTSAEVISTLRAKASLAGIDVRASKNIFRPDVPYKFEGDWGLFSGIEFEVLIGDEQDYESLGKFLEALSHELPLELELDVLDIAGVSEFLNSVTANVNGLLPIIEAVGDRKTAASLVPFLLNLIGGNVDSWGELALVKLWLISGLPLPKVLGDLGWIDAKRLSPNWEPFRDDKSQSNNGQSQELNTPVPDSVSVVPGVRLTVVEQARVFKGDTVLVPDGLLDIDPAANPSFDFVAGRWDHVVGTHLDFGRAAVKVPTKSAPALEEAILLASRVDSNWFHWLIETLPKFQYLDAGVSKDVPVLLSKRIPESAKESIRLLTDRELVYLDEEQEVSVGRLHVASPVLYHPDTPELWLKPGTDAIDFQALVGLREKVLSRIDIVQEPRANKLDLLITRGGVARSLLNVNAILKALAKIGFDSVDPASLAFQEQVRLFSSARRIVFAGGAAMSNLVFCSPGTKVWVLSSRLTENYTMPYVLGEVSRIQVKPISGLAPLGATVKNFASRLHQSYAVPVRKILREVAKE